MVPIYDAFEDRTTFHDNDNDNSNLIVYGLSRVNIMAMSSSFKICNPNTLQRQPNRMWFAKG